MIQVFERLADVFFPKDSADITNAMDKANVRNVNNISLTIILYEILGFIFIGSGKLAVRDTKISLLSIFFVIVFCLFFYIYSCRAKHYETISHIKITVITIVAFIVLAVYGVYLAYDHYRYGKDIITFYIVNITFAAFIIIKPYISIILLSTSFTVCYLVLENIDGASSVHIMNYFALACICIVASAAKYHLMRREQLSKQEAAQLNDALKKAVRYDVLTKLKNRYALIEDSPNYYNKPIYIVMCDCDNFKHINDTYGHIVGDKVIAEIANVFKRNVDEENIYRYGGDEFLIINVGLDDVSFELLKYKIHKQLDSISVDGVEENLTCSFGRIKGIVENGNEFQKMIQQADRNMYKEKQVKKLNK